MIVRNANPQGGRLFVQKWGISSNYQLRLHNENHDHDQLFVVAIGTRLRDGLLGYDNDK